MRSHSWIICIVFLLFSCKQEAIVFDKPSEQTETNSGIVEENLGAKLLKETTLISRVVSFKETTVVEGVKEIRLDYINKEQLPMVLFFFKVDLNNKNITLKPLTPNGGTNYAMQSIPDMVKTNKFAGHQVVGAVNADFFNTSTGEPRSIVVLNQQVVRSTLPTIRSYFGINTTGLPVIGDYSVFTSQRTTIFDALGGYHRLIKQNFPVVQTDTSIHPRTAVGFTANNIVYFLVADGRNTSYSNGLTLTQVAEIMTALEIKEAINLDGGGSSTFVVNSNGLQVSNKPSDGSPRKVANGWAICLKQ